ncbi:MAG: hypothetical protein H0W11_04225 [Gemmatimonadetes bacterium]|nr:hypothetical protein [Gemmatimonadota bacterium]
MPNDSSPAGKLLTWFVVILLAVVAFKVATMLLGTLLGLSLYLLFNIVPIIIAVWLLMRVWRYFFPRHDDFDHA